MATPRKQSQPQEEFEELTEVNPNQFPEQVQNLFNSPSRNEEQQETEFEAVPLSQEEIDQARPARPTFHPEGPDLPAQRTDEGTPVIPLTSEDIEVARSNQEDTEFGRGLSRGMIQTEALATQAFPAAIADALGQDEFARERIEDYQTMMSRAQALDRSVERVEDIEDPGDFANWFSGVLGEQVPNIAGFIVSGGVGGLAGGALKMGAKKFLSSQAQSKLTDEVRKKARDSLIRLGRNGSLKGGVTFGTALGTGEVHGEQAMEGEGEPNPWVSLGAGAAIGSLDVLPFVAAARGVGLGNAAKSKLFQTLRSQPRGRRTAAMGALVGGQEMGTEAAQEVINIAAQDFTRENFEALDDESRSRVLNAAAAGLAVGGTTGVGGGLVSRGLSSGDRAAMNIPGPGDTFRGERVTAVEDRSSLDEQGNRQDLRFSITTDMGDGTSRVTLVDETGEPVQQQRKDRATSSNRSEATEAQEGAAAAAEDQVDADAERGPAPEAETGVTEFGVNPDGSVSVRFTPTNAEGAPTEPEAPGNLEGNLTGSRRVREIDRARPNPSLPESVRSLVEERIQVLNNPTNYKQDKTLKPEAENQLGRIEQQIESESARQGVRNPVVHGEEVVVEEGQAPRTRQEAKDERTGGRPTEEELREFQQDIEAEVQDESLETQPEGGLTREQVREAVRGLQREFPGSPPITVARRDDFQSRPNVENPAARSKGLFIQRADGTQEAFLISDNIASTEEAQRVFIHEVIGHAGIRGIFTEQELEQFLELVRGRNSEMTLAEAEERVARLAEGVVRENKDKALLNRVIALVRRVLRKIMPNLRFSDSEIQEYLRTAATHQQRNDQPWTPFHYLSPEERSRFGVETEADARELSEKLRLLLQGVDIRQNISKEAVRKRINRLGERATEARGFSPADPVFASELIANAQDRIMSSVVSNQLDSSLGTLIGGEPSPATTNKIREVVGEWAKNLGIEAPNVETNNDMNALARYLPTRQTIQIRPATRDEIGRRFAIDIGDPEGQLANAIAFEVLAHEFGHHVQRSAWDRLPFSTKREMVKQFQEFQGRAEQFPERDPRRQGERSAPAEREFDTEASRRGLQTQVNPRKPTYDISFQEWFADQIARTVVGREIQSNNSALQKHFQESAELIRGAYRTIEEEVGITPTESVEEFVDILHAQARNRAAVPRFSEREKDALDLILRKMPEHQVTWSRVIASMEELFLPLRNKPDFDNGEFVVDGSAWGGRATISTRPGVPDARDFTIQRVPFADRGAIISRALREFHRYAAQRGFRYARLGPEVNSGVREFAKRAFGGETLQDGSVSWRVWPEDDDAPHPTIYIKAHDIVRQSEVTEGMDQPRSFFKEFLSNLYVHGRSWQLYRMKFGRIFGTPLQLEKMVQIPEFSEYINVVKQWQRDKVKWIEEAERILEGDDNNSPSIRRLTKEQRARLARAILRVSEESDQREIRNRKKKAGEQEENVLIEGEELREILDEEGLAPDTQYLYHETMGSDLREDGRPRGILRRFLQEITDALKFQEVNTSLPNTFTEEEKRAWLDRWNRSSLEERRGMIRELRELIESLRNQNRADEAPTDAGTLQDRLVQMEINELTMLKRNYFPRQRFGKYAVRMKVKEDREYNGRELSEGDIAEFITYESSRQRDVAIKKQLQSYARKNNLELETSNVPDEIQEAINMPADLKDSIARNLGLNEQQRQELDQIFLATQPGRSFLKHMLERENVGGFSEDVERTLATYMFNGASHLANARHKPQMRQEISDLKARAKEQGENTKEMEIVEYMQEHERYLSNPGQEFVNLRAWGFLWFLGASVRSAFVNLTQVPMVTYPWAATRYGDARTVRHLGKAMKDARAVLTGSRRSGITEEEQAAIQALIDRNIIDQSQVSSIAGYIEGGGLQRMMPNSRLGRLLRETTYYGGWMFHQAELFNRNATALAILRMEKENGTTDFNTLVDRAQEGIEASQFEYNRWNRPKIMRGMTAPIFLFQQHMQNMVFLSFGGQGRGTAARIWGTLFLVSGFLGLPFMDDALDVFDFLGTEFKELFGMDNPKVQSREYMREVLGMLMEQPDLAMHGLGRYYGMGPVHLLSGLGAPIPNTDITSSIQMGDVVPGTELLNREGQSGTNLVGEAAIALGGPVANMYGGIYTAIFGDDPYTWKRVEKGFPRFLGDISQSIRRQWTGEATTSSGARFLEFPNPEDGYSRAASIVEALAHGAGFTSTRESQKWELVMAQKNAAQYWMTRRTMLMENFSWAQASGDQEGLADVRKDIRQFNNSVPSPALKITGKTLKRSLQARRRRQVRSERGLPAQNMYIPIYREIQENFPEVQVDVLG